MKRARVCTLLFVYVLWFATPAACQVYDWKDEQGTVHLTQQIAPQPPAEPPSTEGGDAGHHQSDGSGTSALPLPSPSESDPARDELSRHEARLVALQAHVQLLQASAASRTPDQLRMENLLDDEIRAETSATAELRRKLADGGAP